MDIAQDDAPPDTDQERPETRTPAAIRVARWKKANREAVRAQKARWRAINKPASTPKQRRQWAVAKARWRARQAAEAVPDEC